VCILSGPPRGDLDKNVETWTAPFLRILTATPYVDFGMNRLVKSCTSGTLTSLGLEEQLLDTFVKKLKAYREVNAPLVGKICQKLEEESRADLAKHIQTLWEEGKGDAQKSIQTFD